MTKSNKDSISSVAAGGVRAGLYELEKGKHLADHPKGIIHPNCHFCFIRLIEENRSLAAHNERLAEAVKLAYDVLGGCGNSIQVQWASSELKKVLREALSKEQEEK